MKTFEEIILAWPEVSDFAADISVKPETVRGWRRRNSIPAEYWRAVISKGSNRGIYVSPDLLIDIAARA